MSTKTILKNLIIKNYMEVELHAFLDLTSDVSGQLHTLATLAPGKEIPVTIRYKAG
jgi:hypothetical protein